MHDYNARYYSSYLNRFISPDSIVPDYKNPQSLNRYSYTFNNPILLNDPSGNCPPAKDCLKALAEGAALAVNKANEYREDIFFPDENTTFEERWEASVVVGTSAALIAAEALILAPTVTSYAAVGEATGASGNMIGQVGNNIVAGEEDIFSIDWADVTIAGGVGFGIGAATPILGTTSIGSMALGGLGNSTQYGVSQAVHGEDISVIELILNGSLGVLGGKLGGSAPGRDATHFVDGRDLTARQLEALARFGGGRAFGAATATNIDWQNVFDTINQFIREGIND